MKAQFKYSFKAGLSIRIYAFAAIMLMNLAFIIPGALGLLPIAAQITAVSLSGTAIAVMFAFNIVGDVSITRRMFVAPGAYLYALTPEPRRNTLFSSVITMFVIDFVTMAATIISVVVLSFGLANRFTELNFWEMMLSNVSIFPYFVSQFLLIVGFYLFLVMVILFCTSVRKSVLYNKPAGGFLAVVLAFGIFYLSTVLSLLLAPFGIVSRFGFFFSVSLGTIGVFMYALLLILQAAALFVLTSKLLERKLNI